jgi:hypothetical protein
MSSLNSQSVRAMWSFTVGGSGNIPELTSGTQTYIATGMISVSESTVLPPVYLNDTVASANSVTSSDIVWGNRSFIISASGSANPSTQASGEFGVVSYNDIGQTLFEMRNLEDNDDWKIDQAAYGASVQVAAALMENSFPVPAIFTHGPKSVIFNWVADDRNLYLTVTGDALSVLLSSGKGIEYRTELDGPQLAESSRLISALSYMPLLSAAE